MNKKRKICYLKEDLAVSSVVKPIREYDDLYPDDLEEQEAYWDFITWSINREHATLLSIAKEVRENDFWYVELDSNGNDVSAFNTMDFQKQQIFEFNKYHYRIRKIYEKIKDLAQLHSCISYEIGKKNTLQRYIDLVQYEFREDAVLALKTLKKYIQTPYKEKLVQKIHDLNYKIKKCKIIWNQHAYSC